MNGQVSVIEAVEWREPAPDGGSQGQVFRLFDGRFAIVKFPENPQGELVLANEFVSCQLAERLNLPVNRAILVSVDERLIRLPRQQGQIPNTFSAGIRCGMIRFENAEVAQANGILNHCVNSSELHAIAVFEQLVCRQDGRQLLMYDSDGNSLRQFAAFDYGFSFGGQPGWSAATLGTMPPVSLPVNDPFNGQPYHDGAHLSGIIERLRTLSLAQISDTIMNLAPPRWGLTLADAQGLIPVLHQRAGTLVTQFDERYPN